MGMKELAYGVLGLLAAVAAILGFGGFRDKGPKPEKVEDQKRKDMKAERQELKEKGKAEHDDVDARREAAAAQVRADRAAAEQLPDAAKVERLRGRLNAEADKRGLEPGGSSAGVRSDQPAGRDNRPASAGSGGSKKPR